MQIIHDTGGRSTGYVELLPSGGNTIGSWKSIKGLGPFTVEVSPNPLFDGTCKMYGSCSLTKPPDAVDGAQIGADITIATLHEVTAPINWMKVAVTGTTAGAVAAWLLGHYIK